MSLSVYTPNEQGTSTENVIVHETKCEFGDGRLLCKQLRVTQFDNSLPVIKVLLYKDDARYELPSSNVTVKVRWPLKNGSYVYKEVLGCDNLEHPSIIYFDIDMAMSSECGLHCPILEISTGTDPDVLIAGSKGIPIMVERNPVQNVSAIPSLTSQSMVTDLENLILYAKSQGWIH